LVDWTCTCAYICNTHTLRATQVHTNTHIHAGKHACTRTRMHARAHTHTHTHHLQNPPAECACAARAASLSSSSSPKSLPSPAADLLRSPRCSEPPTTTSPRSPSSTWCALMCTATWVHAQLRGEDQARQGAFRTESAAGATGGGCGHRKALCPSICGAAATCHALACAPP